MQAMDGVRTVNDIPALEKELANEDLEDVRAELQAYYDGLAK